jgi:hypothetical protein
MSIAAFLRRLFRPLTGRQGDKPARSSTPLRIACTDAGSVPPAGDLEGLAVVGRHVVLQFPPSFEGDKQQLIERLGPLLPGHSVFDSGPGPGGTTCVTVLKVIEGRVVPEHLPPFLAAVRDFTDTADRLCVGLAEAHGLRPEDLLSRREEVKGGRLPGGWTHGFHGLECCFTNARTGQVVEVRLCFGRQFGVLDPYFLAHFIRTTPAHREVASLLADDFHDPCRVLEVLRARGHLRLVEARSEMWGGLVRHRGLALANAGSGPPGP